MTNDENIDRQIEETLNSLDEIKRASPKPYLFTRINARLNNQVKSFWEGLAVFINRPAVLVLGLCLILAANVSVLLLNKSSSINTATERSINSVTDEDEYSTSFATIDNFENSEP